jgi:hypothetical protein
MSEFNPRLEARLNAHPHLKARIEELLGIVENAEGDVQKADEAERRVIEELRHLGHELLTDWASGQERRQVEAVRTSADRIKLQGQKKSAGTRRLEK